MLQVLAAGGLFTVLIAMALGFAWAYALRAKRWVYWGIVLVAGAVIAASQTLPNGSRFRTEIETSLIALGWTALFVVPVAAYALLILWARRRAGRNQPGTDDPAPDDIRLIAEDDALFQDLTDRLREENKALAPWDRQTFSVLKRDSSGQIAGGGRAIVNMGIAEIRGLWIAPDHRGQGLGQEILNALETEGRERGAERVLLDTYSWQAEGFYKKQGYTEFARIAYPTGAERIYMVKDLP